VKAAWASTEAAPPSRFGFARQAVEGQAIGRAERGHTPMNQYRQ
jgi:hypothetical protein